MDKKLLLAVSLTIISVHMLSSMSRIKTVIAVGTVCIRADGSVDPPTAPISTVDNITYVFTGDLNDPVIIERDSIVVDGAGFAIQGDGTGRGVSLTGRTEVTIKNITIRDFIHGVWLNQSTGNHIIGNSIASNTTQINNYAIRLEFSTNNNISSNNITSTKYGIVLAFYSSSNTITGNTIRSNIYGIVLDNSQNNILAGNNVSNNMYGIFLFSWADNNKVCNGNLVVGNSQSGVQIVACSGNSVYGNNLTANVGDGVFLDSSTGNSVFENYVRSNKYGVRVYSSLGNFIFHNNFIANSQQATTVNSSFNQWHDGYPSGGNYWSNHFASDMNHDGIGDFSYTINIGNVDNYPLRGMFTTFSMLANQSTNVVSNSTISQFQYNEDNGTITMTVTNSSSTQSFGFCRVCIPKSLMPPPYTVVINRGSTTVLSFNSELHDNGTHRWIYFAYEHSTHEIVIIRESPLVLLLPFFVIGTLLAAKARKRIQRLPNPNN